ncbi:hypothetical protein [Aliiglaciecola lipolytica]|nr:hypothetical protein [Aliiglaciecola lipolytica]
MTLKYLNLLFYFSYFVLLASFPLGINAQEKTDVELWEMVQKLYSKTENELEAPVTLFSVNEILGKRCPASINSDSQYEELMEEAEYWDNNYGLELRGGLTSGDIESSDFDQEGTTYLELSWDVLRNGYKEFEFKAKDLRRKAALKEIAADLDRKQRDYQCRSYHIDNMFVGLESYLGNNKLELLEAVYPIERKAYLTGASYFDDLLISEEELVNIRQKLEYLYTLHGSSEYAFTIKNPPIIDVHIAKILSNIEKDSQYNELLNLEKEALSDTNPYEYGSRLRVFLRKEFDILSSNRDDLVAGVRFSIPLVAADEPSNFHRLQRLEQEGSFRAWERITRVRGAYESFREQKERTLTQQYRYLRSKERMRRVFARKMSGDELNISAVIARLNTYLNAAIELVEAKKSLYQRVNQVFLISGEAYSPELVKVSDISKPNYRSREFQRSLYVWSSSINELSPEQLFLIAKTKGINNLILSIGKQGDLVKQKEIIDLSQTNNISIDFIVGDNSWVNEDKWQDAAQRVAIASGISNRIHLDIEPQALDDYHNKKKQYQNDYIQMLKAIRKASPDQFISVAVPFHWEPETYQQLVPLVQLVYVMNYGSTKIDTLARRTNKIVSIIPHEKVSVVLSMKDFSNEFEVEQAFEQLHQLTGVNRFGIHKLGDLLTLGANK